MTDLLKALLPLLAAAGAISLMEPKKKKRKKNKAVYRPVQRRNPPGWSEATKALNFLAWSLYAQNEGKQGLFPETWNGMPESLRLKYRIEARALIIEWHADCQAIDAGESPIARALKRLAEAVRLERPQTEVIKCPQDARNVGEPSKGPKEDS